MATFDKTPELPGVCLAHIVVLITNFLIHPVLDTRIPNNVTSTVYTHIFFQYVICALNDYSYNPSNRMSSETHHWIC